MLADKVLSWEVCHLYNFHTDLSTDAIIAFEGDALLHDVCFREAAFACFSDADCNVLVYVMNYTRSLLDRKDNWLLTYARYLTFNGDANYIINFVSTLDKAY